MLAANYNASMVSATMMSECITPHRALDLLDLGAKFNSLVLVNGEGKNLIEKIGDPKQWDDETMPRIKSVWLNPHTKEAVDEISNVIGNHKGGLRKQFKF